MKATKVPTFKQFWRTVERRARDRGPEETARLDELRAAFRLARELVRARHDRKLSQSAVARLTGITQADLSRYERGQGNPGLFTLEKLGKVYGGMTVSFGGPAEHSSARSQKPIRRPNLRSAVVVR